MSPRAQSPSSARPWGAILLIACVGCDAAPRAAETPDPGAGGALGAGGVGLDGNSEALCGDGAPAASLACKAGYAGDGVTCLPQPSCQGLPADCGTPASDDCCASASVMGGGFMMGEPAVSLVTVATFALDKYEVTVGRFRKFVEAYAGPPADGAGAHPLIAESGWQSPAWDGAIAGSSAELELAVQCESTYQTWATSGANDRLPMNCVSWYEALAFCAWDGGRLPTEAEWEYAAAGGADQRRYPWGANLPSAKIVVFDCEGDGSEAGDCAFADILPVGSKPGGAGKYGQLDLGGSMWESVLDWYASYPRERSDCASITQGSYRVVRGGHWNGIASYLPVAIRNYYPPAHHSFKVGFRCARTP